MSARLKANLVDAAIFAVTLAILAWATHRVVFQAGNDASRWAHIESLVDFGRSNIDESRYRATVDQVEIDGRHYSNKPPLMALVGAIPYAAIKKLTGSDGWSFSRNEPAVVWLLTLLMVGTPTAILVVAFRRTLQRYWQIPLSTCLWLTAAMAGGTLVASFSVTLNNHTVAASLLFLGFAAVLAGRSRLGGFCCGLALGIDLLPGFVFAPLWSALLFRRSGWRSAVWFAAIILGWIGIVGLADWYTAGSVLPPKLHPRAIDRSAAMGPSMLGVLLPEDPLYPLLCLVGYRGLFSVSPVLLFGVAGMIRCWRRRGPIDRWTTGITGLGCGVIIVGHALFAGKYGGWSYGFRYLIPIMPLVMFFAPAMLTEADHRLRRLFVPVALVSMVFAVLGAYHPWPPVVDQVSAWARNQPAPDLPNNPVGANAAAWLLRIDPSSRLAEFLGRTFIHTDPDSRDRYLVDFYHSKRDLAGLETLMRAQAQAGRRAAAARTAGRATRLAADRGDLDSSARITVWMIQMLQSTESEDARDE